MCQSLTDEQEPSLVLRKDMTFSVTPHGVLALIPIL